MATNNVRVVGRIGGPFTVDGEGFGASGQLLIAGRAVEITRWNDRSVKGMLPADLPTSGDVVLTPAGGEPQTGKWPPEAATAQLVTVRTKDGTLVQGELVTSMSGMVAGPAPKEVTQPLTPAGPDKNPPPGSITNTVPQNVGDAKAAGGGAPVAGSTAAVKAP